MRSVKNQVNWKAELRIKSAIARVVINTNMLMVVVPSYDTCVPRDSMSVYVVHVNGRT